MKTQKINVGLTWFYFFLSIGSLLSSGIYIRNATITYALEDIIPATIFGLLGILWVFLFGEGRKSSTTKKVI